MITKKQKRFLAVGCFNTALDIALLNIFVIIFNMPVLIANVSAVSLAIISSFYLNRNFVFQQATGQVARQFALFLLVTGTSSLIIQTIILSGAHQAANQYIYIFPAAISEYVAANKVILMNIAKMFAIGVGLVWNYFLYNVLVFKNPTNRLNSADQLSLTPSQEN